MYEVIYIRVSPILLVIEEKFNEFHNSKQQEPRLLSHIANVPELKENYAKKKDLYATIGSFVFHKDYWECMEKWQDGSPNPVGKVLRSRCKTLVLGRP